MLCTITKSHSGLWEETLSTSRLMNAEFSLGNFTVDRLATVRFVGVYNGRDTLPRITSFIGRPSEPKGEISGDVATSKALIGSQIS